jgi:hypothetical protein
MIRVGVRKAAVTGRFWRIAALTAAGALVGADHAEAALYYWSDFDPGYYRPIMPQRRQKPRGHQTKKLELPEKESTKPQGPLIIAISIEKQSLKIYDANGIFAQAPVSTGMKGHSTPMGVFSVIQKQKLHHSNIYSGAPMPYMQRITWSGIAIHAGVLPGYPASHGCIRMPMAFATKMWNWTKMGARVVITPGEMTPSSFSHPLLVTQKVVPQPSADPQADTPPAAKSDKASDADTTITPPISRASLELRSTVGHANDATPVAGGRSASASLREQTRTADAGAGMAANQPSATMTDATSSTNNASQPKAPRAGGAPGKAGDAASETAADAPSADVLATGSTKAEEKPAPPKSGEQKPGDATGVTASPSVPDTKKDAARLPDTVKPAAAKADTAASVTPTPKRTGQIAVFVSRKDSKLYVRQNFSPLFDVAVTIAPSDRPLGTHVFTAQIDKADANSVHWSVVSLPTLSRRAERHAQDEQALRRRKTAAVVEAKPSPEPDSPTEALDRLTIPADAMARITEALSTGASIIVSDQGIDAGETGEGTDFIVSLR